ncbi:hypothetical protein JTB14_035175 [Gonioctena quinquepunctata]|nr:hypothetical protein JTB14_035175 [Gonioctena quinquepunctata]
MRTVGDTLLTFEQLETNVTEIEAILNSRPISPMSSDSQDLLPLTPAHFLIGSSLTSFPQVDFTDTPANRLSAWQHAQQLKQHFWNRWHKEYLHQLIKVRGSQGQSASLKVGDSVIISEENLPAPSMGTGTSYSGSSRSRRPYSSRIAENKKWRMPALRLRNYVHSQWSQMYPTLPH